VTPPISPADWEVARRARVEAIRSGAITRQALGITATYQKLPDGRHQVKIRGRTAVGKTVQDAIAELRRDRQ
jgi:hypothetical protein